VSLRRFEAGLKDPNLATAERCNLVAVLVDASDLVASFGKAGPRKPGRNSPISIIAICVGNLSMWAGRDGLPARFAEACDFHATCASREVGGL
jgi:hypothetical protein